MAISLRLGEPLEEKKRRLIEAAKQRFLQVKAFGERTLQEVKPQLTAAKTSLQAQAEAGVSLPQEAPLSRFLKRPEVEQVVEKVAIPYSPPSLKALRQPFKPEVKKFPLGRLATGLFKERPETVAIKEKLQRGETLTPTERKLASEEMLTSVVGVTGDISRLPKLVKFPKPPQEITGLISDAIRSGDTAAAQSLYQRLSKRYTLPKLSEIMKKTETLEKIKVPAYRGQIGELEKQLDKLIGYTPSGAHWKQEYGIRETMLKEAKEAASPEVVKQIERLENTLGAVRSARSDWEDLLAKSVKFRGKMPVPGQQELLLKAKTVLDETRKYVGSINVERLGVGEPGAKAIKQLAKDNKIDLEGQKLTHETVMEEAQRANIMREVVNFPEVKKQAVEFQATRDRYSTLVNRTLEGKVLTPAETQEFVELTKVVNSVAKQRGQLLNSLKVQAQSRPMAEKMIQEIQEQGVKNEEIIKAAEGVNFNNANEATTFYRQFIKPSFAEKLSFYRYVNMLSSPKTQILNFLGNLLQAPLALAEKTAAGLIDPVAAALGRRERQHYLAEVPAYARGFVASIPEAFNNFSRALKGELAVARPDISRIPIGTKGIAGAFGSILRLMEGTDVLFQTLFRNAAKESFATKFAKQGAGEAVNIGGQMMAKDIAIEQLAQKDALYRIFRQELGEAGQGKILSGVDKFTQGIYSLRRFSPVSWFIPFVQTPVAILKQGIEYSPLGVTTIPGAADKTAQLAKAMVGSGAFLGAGWLALNDRTTWSAPKGETEKAAFYASGRKPYAIKIGDTWVQFSRIGPLAYPIAMAAALKEAAKQHPFRKETSQGVATFLREMSRFFSDQSYVTGLNDMINLFTGEPGAIEATAANVIQQVIPFVSFQGWLSRIIDDVYRDPDPQSVVEQIKVSLPFLSKQIPAFVGPGGEESKRQLPLLNALSPFEVSPVVKAGEGAYQDLLKVMQLRKKRQADLDKEKENATNFLSEWQAAKTPEERKQILASFQEADLFTPEMIKQLKTQIKTKAQGRTKVEEAITDLNDAEQAQFVLDKWQAAKTPEERRQLLNDWTQKGIMTKNVIKELKKLLVSQGQAEVANQPSLSL